MRKKSKFEKVLHVSSCSKCSKYPDKIDIDDCIWYDRYDTIKCSCGQEYHNMIPGVEITYGLKPFWIP